MSPRSADPCKVEQPNVSTEATHMYRGHSKATHRDSLAFGKVITSHSYKHDVPVMRSLASTVDERLRTRKRPLSTRAEILVSNN